MYYEINVSLNGRHFFATTKRSCSTFESLQKVYEVIHEKFPVSEGYSILVTSYSTTGTHVTYNDILKD